MDDNADETDIINTGDCDYYDLSVPLTVKFTNSIFHLNVRSLASKVCDIEGLMSITGIPKVFMLSETWLSVNSHMLNIDNYSFISSPRCTGRGGGVAMYIHSTLQYLVKGKSCDLSINNNNIDYLVCELPELKITLVCMYCPPGTDSAVITSVVSNLKDNSDTKTSFIIGGDFNINLLDSQTESVLEFLNSMFSISLFPVINIPTRVTDNSSTLIDNFFCDINLLPVQSSVIKTDLSDHYTIVLELKVAPDITPTIKRNFSLRNKAAFAVKLSQANWDPLYLLNDTNLAFNYFIKKFKRIYNKSFPFFKVVPRHTSKPWLTSGIIKSIRQKNALFIKSKTYPQYRDEYKQYRNQLCNIVRAAKYNYHKLALANLQHKSAKLWSHLKSLLAPRNTTSIPINVHDFNTFFTSVFKQAPKLNPNHIFRMPDQAFVANNLFLSPTTNTEIISTIASLSNSPAVGSDGVTASVIKSSSILIAPHLAYIFNLSFSQGVFPNRLKNAIVIPVYKNGPPTDPSNYRPISLLTSFSKILEKLFHNRLVLFLNKNNVLHDKQFGFTKGKSTTDALTHLLSNLINKHNSKKMVCLALLDLKKAFDFVNHDLLLVKIKHYGIRGVPHQWILDYLQFRTQKCKVNNNVSTSLPIFAGVPQGSILGPLLFNLFINDVFYLESLNIEMYLYADDTAVLLTGDNNMDLQYLIDEFFLKYSKWCSQNCIVINPSKSNFLQFNTNNITVSINGHVLDNPHVVKYLGIYIDDKLNWSSHVKHVTKLCSQRIGLFKKALPYLPRDVTLLYYNAFIRSCFSYCIVFWFNNNRSGTYKLVNMVNKLFSVLAYKCKLSVGEFVSTTQICDVNVVYKLQCLSLMHNIWNNRDKYVYINLVTNSSVHGHFTRLTENIHVDSISSLDRRNFIYHCVLLWNSYSLDIRMLPKKRFLAYCKLSCF